MLAKSRQADHGGDSAASRSSWATGVPGVARLSGRPTRLNELAYCYDKQLLAHPGLSGQVTVQFFISPTGTVQTATGTGFDREIAGCLAGVVASIAFPPPGDGGVLVSYPFQFRTTGP